MSAVKDRLSSGLTRERITLELRRARHPFLLWLALLALALTAGAVILTKLDLPWPWQSEYRFQVAVPDATGVVSGDELRIAGVTVGHVTAVGLQHGQPLLDVEMPTKYEPIYRDARLELRPNTPLQDMYLDITSRGTRSAGAVRQTGQIAVGQTQSPVQIGQLVNIFDASVRPRVTAAINALGQGLGSNGADFREALVELAPFLQAAQRLSQAVAQRRTETERLVHNFSLMTAELATRNQDLSALVRNGSGTLEHVASVEQPLADLINQLPSTLQVLPQSFAAVRVAAGRLDPALRSLLPAARALAPALRALERLSPVAQSGLAALDRPLPQLTSLLDAATPTANGLAGAFASLTPQAPRLDHVTAAIVPCELAVDKFFNWTLSTTKFSDFNGIIPRSIGVLTPAQLMSAFPSCAGGGPRR